MKYTKSFFFNDKIWCRKKIEDTYKYVYVHMHIAMTLCVIEGYEINVDPPKDAHKYE